MLRSIRSYSALCAVSAILVLLLGVTALSAQIETRRVSFAAGTSGATIQGDIRGDQIVDYVLGAAGGQTLSVVFSPTNPSAYFNVMPAGSNTAMSAQAPSRR